MKNYLLLLTFIIPFSILAQIDSVQTKVDSLQTKKEKGTRKQNQYQNIIKDPKARLNWKIYISNKNEFCIHSTSMSTFYCITNKFFLLLRLVQQLIDIKKYFSNPTFKKKRKIKISGRGTSRTHSLIGTVTLVQPSKPQFMKL